jgi:hypothetical protein
MINIIRMRDTQVVYAIVTEGIVSITETETTYDGDIFEVDENYPYTWVDGYECIRAEIEVPENWYGGTHKLVGVDGAYSFEAVVSE